MHVCVYVCVYVCIYPYVQIDPYNLGEVVYICAQRFLYTSLHPVSLLYNVPVVPNAFT